MWLRLLVCTVAVVEAVCDGGRRVGEPGLMLMELSIVEQHGGVATGCDG
jgi:hypothetical protein